LKNLIPVNINNDPLFNITFLKVQSIKNKAISVSNFVTENRIDILAETWLGSNIDGPLIPPGYNFT